MVLWNRTLAKAQAALDGCGENAAARQLDWSDLENAVGEGDVLVSMLPATMHIQVADLCLKKNSHFVSSSYVSPEMRELDGHARDKNLCFVNEVGLDPGIDHLLAHLLMADYQAAPQFAKSNKHYFRSYCGGLPKIPNEFTYKFSWSPLGVLRALTSKAQWIEDGEVRSTERPWKSVTQYGVRLPAGEETFEAYPNRDSLPFRTEYGFGDDWDVQQFVRGTLRLNGWSSAWSDIFDLVDSATGEEGQKKLAAKSEELWENYQYDPDEPDRVVLCVELEVKNSENETVWHQVHSLDEAGNDRGTAMARLVSLTASIAVEAVLDGKIAAGVSPAPSDLELVNDWMNQLADLGEAAEKLVVV